MTDEINKPTFKAPPLPPKVEMPQRTPSAPAPIQSPSEQRQVEGTFNAPAAAPKEQNKANAPLGAEVYANNFAAELNLPPKILETKVMGAIMAGVLFFGMMMGCAMFGGESRQVVQGLTDVVLNPDIQTQLYRCGQVDPNRECVLYIMNNKTFDRLGSDFFQEAQNMTGIQKYAIQLRNVRYANALIRPGYIAQIYIPARK